MKLVIKLFIIILNIIYFFIKIFTHQRKKVVFISRQSNSPSIDFTLISKSLKKKGIETKILCKTIDSGVVNHIKYCIHMFNQMYHIATSKVLILDSYSICASVLKHKKNLKIIQMWHAMGSLKKFGYSILDKKEGSSYELAKLMKMHKNYDYVFASSENSRVYFAQAFNVDVSKVMVMPQARIDLIKNKDVREKTKGKILKKYPMLKGKLNILYAPTFRKNEEKIEPIKELIDSVNFKKYNLIIKMHPLSKLKINDKRVIVDNKFSTIEMSYVSSYVISDYSAIIFEVALLNKPLFFYAYDKDEYINNRNFYMDYDEMPGVISSSAKKIITSIENNEYDISKVRKFAHDNVEEVKNGYTNNIVNFIITQMN